MSHFSSKKAAQSQGERGSPLLQLSSFLLQTAAKVPHCDSPQVFCPVSGIQPLIKTGLAEKSHRKSAHFPFLFSPGAGVQGLKTGEACLLCKPPQDPQHWPNCNSPSFSCSRTGQAPLNTLLFIITCRHPTCTFLLSSLPITTPSSLEHMPKGMRGKTPFSYHSSSKGRPSSSRILSIFPFKTMVTKKKKKKTMVTGGDSVPVQTDEHHRLHNF